ncbi:MAG: glutamine synthetase family protein [Stappiaceae bacterium]
MDRLDQEDWFMLTVCDYAGQVRGKAVPMSERSHRLDQGMGLAPTSMMISAFGEISATPWGPRGELLTIPDPKTEVVLPALNEEGAAERFMLCDIVELDGAPWACCPRQWLNRGLEILRSQFGLELKSAFEHEFHYSGGIGRLGDAYLLDAMRLQGRFAGTLMAALRKNGIEPESFMPEYGPAQYEVTMKPANGLRAADNAVRLREITRAVARGYGHRASFSPVMAPNIVGNGVHIHFSLEETSGRPITYDPDSDFGIGERAGSFAAGILEHMADILALAAPSVVSYERLQPNRWSATWNNLGSLDREAGIRLWPLSRRAGADPVADANLEFRACDGAANPYLALGALVYAGLDGLRRNLTMPEPTQKDPADMTDEERAHHKLERLPENLEVALERLEKSAFAKSVMGGEFLAAYITHKRGEMSQLADLDLEEVCRRYGDAY